MICHLKSSIAQGTEMKKPKLVYELLGFQFAQEIEFYILIF